MAKRVSIINFKGGVGKTTLALHLARTKLTKNDLIRLAEERFGIPRSKLERQRIEFVMDELKAALRNEQTLDIISQEASRGELRKLF